MNDRFFEGRQLYRGGKYRQALSELLRVSDNPADEPDLAYYLGLCYSKLEEWDDALFYLEQVVNSHDNILRIYQSRMILSYIYTITGRIKLAEFELNKLIKDGFESPQVYANFGYIYFETGKPQKSLEALEKALDLDPENINAMNSMGYILADTGGNPRKAVELCREVVKKRPDNPAYLDSLGWSLYRLGRYEEARETLKKAFEQSGGDKTISAHLRTVIDRLARR